MRSRVRKPDTAADLLYGMEAIGAAIGLTARQVEHLIGKQQLPAFKLGGTVCARRSELDAHFARASSATRDATSPQALPASGGREILYGHRAIAVHLGISAGDVTRLDAERRLPTYQDDGCTVASAVALDHWKSLKGGR